MWWLIPNQRNGAYLPGERGLIWNQFGLVYSNYLKYTFCTISRLESENDANINKYYLPTNDSLNIKTMLSFIHAQKVEIAKI